MIGLFWNILLATCWVFLTGSFEALNYFFGFAVGYLVIALIHDHVTALKGYPSRLPKLIAFICYFIGKLIQSNIEVAVDIITPVWRMRPGVVRFKTSINSDIEMTLLTNLISLTPGTLVLDVSEDRKTLFVHAMFAEDKNQVQAELKQLEQRFLSAIR